MGPPRCAIPAVPRGKVSRIETGPAGRRLLLPDQLVSGELPDAFLEQVALEDAALKQVQRTVRDLQEADLGLVQEGVLTPEDQDRAPTRLNARKPA